MKEISHWVLGLKNDLISLKSLWASFKFFLISLFGLLRHLDLNMIFFLGPLETANPMRVNDPV